MCHILAPQADAKKRRACGKRKLVGRRRPNIIVALEQSMLVDIKSMAKARRAVTFLWLRRIASRHLEIWKERGGANRKLTASPSMPVRLGFGSSSSGKALLP